MQDVRKCVVEKDVRSRCVLFFFFKAKTAYEISDCDWRSDVCSSYLYATNGYSVPRKLGYDTHGLPIEYEADKRLGIKSSNYIVSEAKFEEMKKSVEFTEE